MDALITRCIAAAGDRHTAGIILYRLCYWQPKAGKKRDGKVWVAKPKSEWQQECRTTEQQHSDAITLLKNLGLIELKRAFFKGSLMLHLRLTPKAVAMLQTHESQGLQTPSAQGFKTVSHIQGDSLQGDTYFLTGNDASSILADEKIQTFSEGNGDMKPGTKKSVSEIMATAKSVPKTPKDTSTTGALVLTWKERVPKEYGAYVAMNQKDVGMLGQFRRKCPPGEAYAVLNHVLDDWQKFCAIAETDAGGYKLPTKPSIPVLLKFVAVAVTMMKPVKVEETSPSTNPNKLQLTAKKKAKSNDAATLDEVKALLGWDK